MNILSKLKQINILNILSILVVTLLLSLANNYLSKKPLDLIYKPKPVIEDNLLFGEIDNQTSNTKNIELNANSNLDKVDKVDELEQVEQVEPIEKTENNQILDKNVITYNNSKTNASNQTADMQKESANKNNSNKNISENNVTNSAKDKTLNNLEKVVNYNQVLKIIGNNNFVIIDARSVDDYSKGKIADAINIFPYNENENEYFQQIMSLPRDKRFLIYCTGGNCDLSHHLAEDMVNFGFSNIFIYTGGWEDWEKKSQNK